MLLFIRFERFGSRLSPSPSVPIFRLFRRKSDRICAAFEKNDRKVIDKSDELSLSEKELPIGVFQRFIRSSESVKSAQNAKELLYKVIYSNSAAFHIGLIKNQMVVVPHRPSLSAGFFEKRGNFHGNRKNDRKMKENGSDTP